MVAPAPQRLFRAAGALLLSTGLALTCPVEAATAKRKNPTSKVYITEIEGQADIDTGERIESLAEKSVYDASDTIIETKIGGSNAMVFSNGTGLYLGPETRLQVVQFVQEPFLPNRSDLEVEPSISRLHVSLRYGSAGFCTARMIAGSSLQVDTPHGTISVRGKRVAIEVTDAYTSVTLFEGDVTVIGGAQDAGGRTLLPGQQATVRPAAAPTEANSVELTETPEPERQALEDTVTLACMARRTVYFESVDADGNPRSGDDVFAGDEPETLQPVVLVPSPPPNTTIVSPSEISNPAGGGA